jgi:hypothetical protein
MKFHPIAEAFPLIEGAEFQKLVEDIRQNGLHNPIALLDSMILDGRNRYLAALKAGLRPDELRYIAYGALEAQRVKKFDRAYTSIVTTCSVAENLEIPQLTQETAKECTKELNKAVSQLKLLTRAISRITQ